MANNADAKPLRYAHPFYTPTPPEDRPTSLVAGATRMVDWIAKCLPILRTQPPAAPLVQSSVGAHGTVTRRG